MLQTLWLLILASLLTTVVMTTSLSNARNSAAAAAAIHVELAAESAVHKVIYEMLTLGPHNAWGQQGPAPIISIDGAEVSVSVVDASGLVDLNAVDEVTLRRLIAVTLPSIDTATLTNEIKAARPLVDYATLAALDGMSSEIFESLFPYVTLFSRQSLPSSASAPSWLAKALHLERVNSGVLSDTSSITGRLFRIEAIARSKAATSRRLTAELLITGRLDQPYWVYDWSWHSVAIKR